MNQQHEPLTAAGCTRTFTSGVRHDRPGLVDLLGYARAGDTGVAVALDRLGQVLQSAVPISQDLPNGAVAQEVAL